MSGSRLRRGFRHAVSCQSRSSLARAAAEALEGRTLLSDVPFVARPAITTSALKAHAVYSIDLDSDGDIDIVSASQQDNTIRWFENNGSGTFTTRTVGTSETQAGGVFAIDLDKDGDVDVLSAAEAGHVTFHRNDGSENFTAINLSASAVGANAVFAADLDGDGDLDVIADNVSTDSLVWYENDGASNFTLRTIAGSRGVVKGVFAIDLDRDGDIDVLSAAQNSNDVVWYENNGTGSFTARMIDSNADSSRSVFAADLDGDGDIDVVQASYDDDTVSWYRNNGSQSFTKVNIATNADGASGVYVADIDMDGDKDVLVSTLVGDSIIWYENLGAALAFAPRTIATDADQAQDVTVGDYDGDGDPDVASASFADNKIAWYENAGGRMKVDVTDVSSASVGKGQTTALFKAVVQHLGASTDNPDRLASLRVRFVNDGGNQSLTTDQANALIDNLKIYRDANGNGTFNSSADTLVATADTLSLDGGGGQTFFFDLNDANVQFGPGAPMTLFVVADISATGATATPNAFKVSGVTASGADRVSHRTLVVADAPIVATGTITVSDQPVPPPPPPGPPPPGSGGEVTATAAAVVPESAVAGVKTKGKVRVAVGNAMTTAFHGSVAIDVFTSIDGAVDGNDALAATITKVLKIKAGKSKAVNLKIAAFPATLTDGSYKLLARVTPTGGSVVVADAGTITNVASPFVNLVGAIAGPATLVPGKKGSAKVTALNLGNVDLAGIADVKITATLAGSTTPIELAAATPVKLKLKPQKTKRATIRFNVPADLAAGQYVLSATFDANNAIPEADETDNESASPTPTNVG